MKTLIAVDPGATGGIAVRGKDGSGNVNVTVHKTPATRRDAIEVITGIVKNNECVAYMEKINGYIPDGGASQMFEFGKAVERMGCILETLGVPVIEIPPQAWQKVLGLGKSERKASPKNATAEERQAIKRHNERAKREWKNKLKEEAQRRFPRIKVTLANCDALLLLEAARVLEGAKA